MSWSCKRQSWGFRRPKKTPPPPPKTSLFRKIITKFQTSRNKIPSVDSYQVAIVSKIHFRILNRLFWGMMGQNNNIYSSKISKKDPLIQNSWNSPHPNSKKSSKWFLLKNNYNKINKCNSPKWLQIRKN